MATTTMKKVEIVEDQAILGLFIMLEKS